MCRGRIEHDGMGINAVRAPVNSGNCSGHGLLYISSDIPVFFIVSALLRETPVHHINILILLSVAFQGVIIAFVSYLLWFFLVHAYPASLLSAFTFLTPLFATIAGIVFLNEQLTVKLVVALILVSLGIYIVNRK